MSYFRMCADVRSKMAKTRAIMTETERKRIAGQEDVEEIKKYQAISRVRRRIEEELSLDVAILREHHPELLEELRDVVCGREPEQDIAEYGLSEDEMPNLSEEAKEQVETSRQEFEEGDHVSVEGPTETEDSGDNLRDQMETKLEELNIKGRPEAVKRARRRAAAYAWERLREEGEMKPSRLADDTLGKFFDDPDLGYSTASGEHPGYQLLDNFLRETVRELPGVHPRHQTWEFREPGENDE